MKSKLMEEACNTERSLRDKCAGGPSDGAFVGLNFWRHFAEEMPEHRASKLFFDAHKVFRRSPQQGMEDLIQAIYNLAQAGERSKSWGGITI